MGLRTASVRHPHAEVMAPALTDAAQSKNFNLPPTKTDPEPASPINSYEKNKYQGRQKRAYCKTSKLSPSQFSLDVSNAVEKFVASSEKCSDENCSASDNSNTPPVDIMNISPSPMGDHTNKMGLQKTGLDVSTIHKEKISNDMEQLLNNLSSVLPETENATGDLGPNVEDIMQVIKSMEGRERLNNPSENTPNDMNSEGEEIFPMPGTDLTNNLSSFEKELLDNVDVMNISMEDQQDELDTIDKQKESQAREVLNDLQRKHAKVERRLDFLRRRVYKLQSRMMGQHISSEIAGVFENVQRSFRRVKDHHENMIVAPVPSELEKIKPSPMSYGSAKTLLRKLEMTSVLQANLASKHRHATEYFGSGSVEVPTFRNTTNGGISIPPWPLEAKSELQKVAAQLKTQLTLVQSEVDSEATESSSGGESCDEMQTYNNPHQQYLSVQKRALWRYSLERAAIAARWTWLQAQIADLEYRIRQHTDLLRQVRQGKGAVRLGGGSPPAHLSASEETVPTAVNGYRGQLPGAAVVGFAAQQQQAKEGADATTTTTTADADQYTCARGRPLLNFRKRKLLQVRGLHAVSKKAARPSTVRCGCCRGDAASAATAAYAARLAEGGGAASVAEESLAPPISASALAVADGCCAVCTGRTDATHPRDPPDTQGRRERVALLDPGYHPVFSMPEDTSVNIHLEAIMKTSEWQQRCTRLKSLKSLTKPERLEAKALEHHAKKLEHRKKYGRLLKPSTISALSAKIKSKIRGRKPGRHGLSRLHRKRLSSSKEPVDQLNNLSNDGADEEVESIGNNANMGARSSDSPSSSPLLHMQTISGYNKRNRVQSYDIDNIVIPYSVAASTRVEKLQYKEILTPKWRIAEQDYDSLFDKNNPVRDPSQDSDGEDMSDEAVVARHDRCEHEEKKRFLSYLKLPMGHGRQRSHKRTDSRAESSGANTPDPMSPHNATLNNGVAAPGGQTALSGAGVESQEAGAASAGGSPMISPPATPQSLQLDDSGPLPSIAVMRRRTMSACRWGQTSKEELEAPEGASSVAAAVEEVAPYDRRTFPISEDLYEQMIKSTPENHQLQTNTSAQDSNDYDTYSSYLAAGSSRKDSGGTTGTGGGGDVDSVVDSESTESAVGDCEEDPNDPEWIDMERANRDRYKR